MLGVHVLSIEQPLTYGQPCLGELCYTENNVIKTYLDDPATRDLLGVETPNKFAACSQEVGRNFAAHLDKYAVPAQNYVASLLDRGVRMLIYAGTYDWQCNWVANKLWVDKLEWSGSEAYQAQTWRDWTLDGQTAGQTKHAGPLTFATILGAGHMISLHLVFDW